MNALAGRIRLDFRSDEPIYTQVVRQMELLVNEGILKAGDQLPTVRELAIDLRINFSTVARAYRILDEKRLISTQRGRGTYIWEEPRQPEVSAQNIDEGRPGEASPAAQDVQIQALARRFIEEASALGFSLVQIQRAFDREASSRM